MARPPRIALAVVAALLFAACGSESGPSSPLPTLVAVGRQERGATVRLVARNGELGSDSSVSNVTVTPAAAGTVNGATVKLLQVGIAIVGATASDGRAITATLTVAPPPTVFFDGVVAGNRDIYSVSLDGGDLKRWTTAAAEESHPTVAGRMLVYASTRDGNGELYALSTDAGGTERRLTTSVANESQPALSIAGVNLAYVSDAIGVPRIYVGPAALTSSARLTAPSFGFGGSIESDPSWSLIGDRIALVSTTNGRANLFISSSAAGSTPSAVAGSGNQQTDIEPAWGTNSNLIAFASTRAGGTLLFLLDQSTGAIRQVAQSTNASGQPAWLPDGRLVYTVFAGGESTLWFVDPADTAPASEIPTGTKSPAHPACARP
jgi:Tol biopolymer transport system component